MKMHYLQHVPFEGPGYIENWCEKTKTPLNKTALYNNEPLPELDDFDCLVIMGGPMSIHDEHQYPWLKPEKKLVQEAIENYKFVLGICLGAQLIADVLGARVYKNSFKEIGWFPVVRAYTNGNKFIYSLFPDIFHAFHWHGETFEIPDGADYIAGTEACKNQAFVFQDRVFALQFHLETTEESVELLLENCKDELVSDEIYIQSAEEIRKKNFHINESNSDITMILDYIKSRYWL